jgi:hypothetical protein
MPILYPLTIDVRAIRASQVGQHPALRDTLNLGMASRDTVFGQHHIVLVAAPKGKHGAFQCNDPTCQLSLLED